jgi:hypothetical protein
MWFSKNTSTRDPRVYRPRPPSTLLTDRDMLKVYLELRSAHYENKDREVTQRFRG